MRSLILLMALPVVVWGQEYEFRREIDTIPVEINGYLLPAPWTGGYTVTRPALCDWDGDGDKDCFVGHSEGAIAYYENLGDSTNFLFKLADPTWLGFDLDSYSSPEFLDFDNDGDYDLFVSSGNQPASLWENIGDPMSPQYILAEEELRDSSGAVIDAFFGTWADIDGDGNLDFFVGDWDYGTVSYYHNNGSGWNYSLQLVTTNLLGTGVGNWPAPRFCDLDADGDFDLFIGNFNGSIWYYRNDGTPGIYNFTMVSSNWLGIDVGNNSSPELADMDGDGDYDLWVGRDVYDLGPDNTPGDIYYFENIGTPQLPQFRQVRTSNLTLDAGQSNLPVIYDFNASSNLDLVISNLDYLIYYQNSGTVAQPFYELVTENYLNNSSAEAVDLYDLDSDGDPDMVSANGALFNGQITFYENIGSAQNPQFAYAYTIQTPYQALGTVTLADMDADGDGDMLFSAWGQGLVHYQNVGTPQLPDFVLLTENWLNIGGGRNPRFADMDLDGDYDLLTGFNVFALVELWENVGTPQNAQMVLADSNFCSMQISSPKPAAGDLDNDSDMDLLVGSDDGGIYFFRNVTGEPPAVPPLVRHPQAGFHLSIGPNPANPVTFITFSLPYPQEATLAVYNLLGARVTTLTSGLQPPGEQSFLWDAGGKASGVYIIRLETEKYSSAQRLTVVK